MKYYIELDGDDATFRLQKDNSWRKLSDKSFEENDLFTENESELLNVQKINSKIELDGKTWKLNPTSGSLFEKGVLNYRVYTKRDIKPEIPSKEQLIETIANGNDRQTNTLILNTTGKYSLVDVKEINQAYDYPNVVARNEAFIAGNGYVGKEASKHARFIDDLYNESLECWLIHLEKGITNLFSDGAFKHRKIEEVIDELEKFKI